MPGRRKARNSVCFARLRKRIKSSSVGSHTKHCRSLCRLHCCGPTVVYCTPLAASQRLTDDQMTADETAPAGAGSRSRSRSTRERVQDMAKDRARGLSHHKALRHSLFPRWEGLRLLARLPPHPLHDKQGQADCVFLVKTELQPGLPTPRSSSEFTKKSWYPPSLPPSPTPETGDSVPDKEKIASSSDPVGCGNPGLRRNARLLLLLLAPLVLDAEGLVRPINPQMGCMACYYSYCAYSDRKKEKTDEPNPGCLLAGLLASGIQPGCMAWHGMAWPSVPLAPRTDVDATTDVGPPLPTHARPR